MKPRVDLRKDAMYYTVASLGGRAVSFIVTPVTIYYFSSEQYGYMSLVTTIGTLCFIVGLLGIVDQGLPRFFIDSEGDTEKGEYLSTAVLISGIGILAVSCLVLLASPLLPVFFSGLQNPLSFGGIVVLVCLGQAVYYVGGNLLKWSFKSRLFAIIALSQSGLSALISLGGMIFFGWRVHGVIATSALVSLCAGLWANAPSHKNMRISMLSKKKGLELLWYSWPLLGLSIFGFFTRSLDRIFLASLKGLEEAGVYAVASAVGAVQEMAVSGFFFAWGPYVLSNYREKWAPEVFSRFFAFLSWVTIISVIFLGLWGAPIIDIIRTEGTYTEIGIYIPWIVAGTGLYYLGGYFAPGPNIVKKTHWKLIVFSLAACLNAALNFLLIPRFGALGAGIATTVASLGAGILNQVVSNRFYFIPNRWRKSFGIIIAFTIVVSVIQTAGYKQSLHLDNMIVRLGVTIGFAFASGLLFRAELKKMQIIERLYRKRSHKE